MRLSIWSELCRLRKHLPLESLKGDVISVTDGDADVVVRIDRALKRADSTIVVLLGAWGSGKTSQLGRFKNKYGECYRIRDRYFFGLQSLGEGLAHLSSPRTRVGTMLVCAVLVGLSQRAWILTTPWLFSHGFRTTLKPAVGAILTIAGILIFQNRARWLYLCSSLLSSIWTAIFWNWRTEKKRKPKLIVLEDLDRSSMSVNDQWSLLATLWRSDHKYLVAYGYSSAEGRIDAIERVAKLGGHLIELPISADVNLGVAKMSDPDFPFESGKWLTAFTARDLIQIIDDVRVRHGHEPTFYRQILTIRRFKDEVTRMILQPGEDPDQIIWALAHEQPTLTAKGAPVRRPNTTSLEKGFGPSILEGVRAELRERAAKADHREINQMVKDFLTDSRRDRFLK